MRFTTFALALLISSSSFSAQFIGFWEESGVRAIFRREGRGWASRKVRIYNRQLMQNLPQQFATPNSWRVYSQGKDYGSLATTAYPAYAQYLEIGLQKIESAPDVSFRETSSLYGNFIKTPGIRPVLLTDSKLPAIPPLNSGPATKMGLEAARKKFIAKLSSSVQFFKDPGFQYRDSNRKIQSSDLVEKFAFHGKGLELIGLNLSPSNAFARCKTSVTDCLTLQTQWFFIKGRTAVFLGEGAAFLEMADVDDDKKPEFFFLLNHAAEAGYALVTSHGTRIEYTWGSQ